MAHPIVVAHSGSGLLLPAIARAVNAGMQMFVAAWIPDGANSLMDELSAGPERIFHSDWLGKDPVTDPDVARSFLFHDCSAELADWATTTLRTFYPAKVYAEVVQPAAECRSAAIVPLGDRTLRWEWMAEAARDRLGVEPHMIPGGHCPHVSRREQLADLIASAWPTPDPPESGRQSRS